MATQTHTHAPPGASGGQTALGRLLAADWSKGIPAGYLEALDRLRRIRSEFEEQIAAAIDGLDILDMAIADLEPEEDANEEDQGGEPSLGAPEAVTCSEGPADPVRKERRNRSRKPLDANGEPVAEGGKPARRLTPSIDRSCDQERWAQGTSDAYTGLDAELDTADDEPSLGAPEQRLSITTCVNGYWFTRPTDQADWTAGCSDDREGNLADVADDREGGDVSDEPHDQDTDLENTAPERFGGGFVRCGHDDAEDDEEDYEDERDGRFDDDMEPDARRAPRVPVGIGLDGAIQELVVGRVVEDGGIIALGTVEAANV